MREWDWRVAKRFDVWSQRRLEAAKTGPNPLPVSVPVQVFALGDLAIVAVPMELLSQTGIDLRAASPARDLRARLLQRDDQLSPHAASEPRRRDGSEAGVQVVLRSVGNPRRLGAGYP